MKNGIMAKKNNYKLLPHLAGISTMLVGVVVLIGWQFGIESLKSILPTAVSMKANTATLFIFSGLSVVLLQKPFTQNSRLVQLLSSVIMLVALLSFLENLFGWDFNIDELLYQEPPGTIGTLRPGLMAPYTALNFMLISLALLFLTFGKFQKKLLMDFLVVFPLSVSFIGLFGYMTGYLELAGPVAFTKMAINTSVAFFLLCVGLFFSLYNQRSKSITMEQRLLMGLTVSLVIIVYISLLSISGIQSINKANENVEQTLVVKQGLAECLTMVVDVETGARGYLISGDESYTEPLKKATQLLPGLLKNVEHNLGANLHQKSSFIELEGLIDERIEIANQLYQTRQTEGTEMAISHFLTGKGKMLTDSIRSRIAHILDEQDQDFQTKNLVEKIQSDRTQTIIIGSIVIQVILLVFIFIILKRDMDARRKAEFELHNKKEQLEKLNAEKDKFFSIIAHDLKSPFNSILGLSHLLVEQVKEKDYLGVDSYAETIQKSSQRVMDLLTNLLEWSRSQTGRMEFQPKSIDVVKLIDEVVELISETTRQKSITVKKQLPIEAFAFADSEMISAVIRNLLSNAIKFTHPEGEVVVELIEKQNKLQISVADNGIGIPENRLGSLFKVGENNSTLGTQKEKGTGLGLILCKEFIDMHGGKIWAVSKVGKGSTFSIMIPLANGHIHTTPV
jgi:signal transduction histidine kinase